MATEGKDKKVAALQGRWEEAEDEAALPAMEVKNVQEELGEAERLLLRARGKTGEEEKAGLGPLVGEVGKEAGMIDTDASVSLVGALSKKKGERWSQGITELAMEIMEKNLSGGQAESVTRAFVAFQRPHLVENVDYRIPPAASGSGASSSAASSPCPRSERRCGSTSSTTPRRRRGSPPSRPRLVWRCRMARSPSSP